MAGQRQQNLSTQGQSGTTATLIICLYANVKMRQLVIASLLLVMGENFDLKFDDFDDLTISMIEERDS